MRKGVDFVGVSIIFLVHDGKGNICLQKRSKNTRDEHGRWDVGGGALEFGESIDETVKREIYEELRAKIVKTQFLAAGDAHREHDGEKTHWVWLLHAVKVDPKTVSIGEPDKIDEIGWFGLNNLPSPMHSQFGRALDEAKKHHIIR